MGSAGLVGQMLGPVEGDITEILLLILGLLILLVLGYFWSRSVMVSYSVLSRWELRIIRLLGLLNDFDYAVYKGRFEETYGLTRHSWIAFGNSVQFEQGVVDKKGGDRIQNFTDSWNRWSSAQDLGYKKVNRRTMKRFIRLVKNKL